MLPHDPTPWLMAQEGLGALRVRRMLALEREGDEPAARALVNELSIAESREGLFADSPMKTAGLLNLLDDLCAGGTEGLVSAGASYLVGVLESQPGYERARGVAPGSLRTPCDLAGFFGPYADRGRPEALARGAQEMNSYRQYEPLLGPKTPVRMARTSSLDRAGPASCYSWGLIPLCYTLEALCRAGYARDERLRPAINALLGAQRESGGWCRNLGGHPGCTPHALRALGAHPDLRYSPQAERALRFVYTTAGLRAGWRGASLFAMLQAVAAFDLPLAGEILRDALAALEGRQRKDGTFGGPCEVERVAAVLVAVRAIGLGDTEASGARRSRSVTKDTKGTLWSEP